jgi:predicted aconitase with swiveling domain
MGEIVNCKPILAGHASGKILASDMALSFWGGVDTVTGNIIDPRHDLFGQCLTGRVLVFPFAKGSAGAPAIILELIARRTSPAAMVNLEAEPLLISGPILGRHLYGTALPVVTVSPDRYASLQTGAFARVDTAKGEIRVSSGNGPDD